MRHQERVWLTVIVSLRYVGDEKFRLLDISHGLTRILSRGAVNRLRNSDNKNANV